MSSITRGYPCKERADSNVMIIVYATIYFTSIYMSKGINIFNVPTGTRLKSKHYITVILR